MNKTTILFIQGGGKGAYEMDKALALYLKDALGKTFDIQYPKMPKENEPDYDLWKVKFDQELKKIDNKVILAGHSVGGYLLLKYLSKERVNKDMAGLFFISIPFVGEEGWQYEDMALENDFASKLPHSAPVFFYHSTDDEIVPFSHLTLYANKVSYATIRKIVGRGHQLNGDLTEIVQDIKNLERKN